MEKIIQRCWEYPAYTNYGIGESYTYGDVAKMVARLHQLFKQLGIEPGNKIALCDRNHAHWAIAFHAAFTYGAVVVPILSEFSIEQIQNIYNHSESVLMICGQKYADGLQARILNIADFTMKDEPLAVDMTAFSDLQPVDVHYFREQPDDLALLSYTSGSTGRSKGVMLPYRSVWSNMQFADEVLDFGPGDRTLAILPMAHMYGFSFDFLFEFCIGCHVHFLTKTPSPHIVIKAFSDIKPAVVIVVPLILEKIVQKQICAHATSAPSPPSPSSSKWCIARYATSSTQLWEDASTSASSVVRPSTRRWRTSSTQFTSPTLSATA
jgi:long-chain acyl-CoA synthetase